MKKLIFFVIIIFMAGCVDEVIEKNPDIDFLKSAKKVGRDVKMFNMTGTLSFEKFDDGKLGRIAIGEGISTHLGKFKLYESYCVDEYGIPVLFVEGYFTAANGDKIFYNVSWFKIDEETGITEYGQNILGGTGRFQKAEGEIVTSVIMDWVNGTWIAEASGTISY